MLKKSGRSNNQAFLVLFFIVAWPVVLTAQDTGTQVYGRIVREIRVQGAHFTDTDIITRELASKVGQPYTKENADKDFNRLDKLDIFSSISIAPLLEDDGVVLEIKVVEIFPYLPYFSYEVTDENGFAGGPGIQSANLFGRDIFVSASARFGGATNINLLLENPWVAGNHLGYVFEFYQRERFNDLSDFNETATEFDLRVSSYIKENGRIGGRLSFISIKSDSTGRTLSADNRDNIPTLAFFLGYDSRDLWSNPHAGWWNEFEIAHSGLPGFDGDYWTFTFDIRRYLPLVKNHTLALFSLTSLRPGEVGDQIPLHQRFHLGGTNTIRGWNLDAGRGKNQFINTAEYRITLMEPRLLRGFGLSADIGLQFALFGDLGVAWNNSDQFDRDHFIGGYGFGIRLLTPFINMFRFDVGFGEPGESFMVHIGAFEKPVAQRFRVR